VTLLGEEQGRTILASRSGSYIATLLNNAHAVVPPELQPHLQRIEQRLNPDGPLNATAAPPAGDHDLQDLWQRSQSQTPQATGWPQQPTTAWPATPSSPQPPAWPVQTQSSAAPTANPYATREPNPFPGYIDGTPVSVEREPSP
jgi:hypothetical protein